MVPSTQALPCSEAAWLTPPGSARSRDLGKRLRTSRLPSYGVAASSVSSMRSAGGAADPSTCTGLPAFAGQVRHGMLNQVFGQVSNEAVVSSRSASARHVLNDVGH